MFSLITLLLILQTLSNPQLLSLSDQNQCIQRTQNMLEIITEFQNKIFQLAIKITNCLFLAMGKQPICQGIGYEKGTDRGGRDVCQVEGDAWNTFAIFFAHIDNLCHFYWDLSKAERTDQMIDALLQSSKTAQKSLDQNNHSTKQILQLQQTLKLQILSSIATQQQMAAILTNSSSILNTLTSQLSSSLSQIHQDIEQNYATVNRILNAVNNLLVSVDGIYDFVVVGAGTLEGIGFFFALCLSTGLGCVFSVRVRYRRNQCLMLISGNFIVQYFFGGIVSRFVSVQSIRFAVVALIALLVLSSKPQTNELEKYLNGHLNSQRISRLIQKALKNEQKQMIKQ